MGNEPVSDLQLLDMTPDQINHMIDNLAPEPALSREQETDLLARLPSVPTSVGPTVVSSLRLPLELKQRIDEAASELGVSSSTFIRRAVEAALAGRDRTNLVNLDDVIRAIQGVPHAA
jgi:predicted DNA-binding protein